MTPLSFKTLICNSIEDYLAYRYLSNDASTYLQLKFCPFKILSPYMRNVCFLSSPAVFFAQNLGHSLVVGWWYLRLSLILSLMHFFARYFCKKKVTTMDEEEYKRRVRREKCSPIVIPLFLNRILFPTNTSHEECTRCTSVQIMWSSFLHHRVFEECNVNEQLSQSEYMREQQFIFIYSWSVWIFFFFLLQRKTMEKIRIFSTTFQSDAYWIIF